MLRVPSPRQIEEDLQEILERLGYTSAMNGGVDIPEELIEIVLIMVLGAVLLWIASIFIRKYSGIESFPAAMTKNEEIALVEKKDYETLYKKGVTLGKKGKYTEAIRVLYMGILILLDVNKVIVYHPWVTNYEYRQNVKQYPFSDLFCTVTRIFDTVYYGGKKAVEKDFERFIDAFTHMQGNLS